MALRRTVSTERETGTPTVSGTIPRRANEMTVTGDWLMGPVMGALEHMALDPSPIRTQTSESMARRGSISTILQYSITDTVVTGSGTSTRHRVIYTKQYDNLCEYNCETHSYSSNCLTRNLDQRTLGFHRSE